MLLEKSPQISLSLSKRTAMPIFFMTSRDGLSCISPASRCEEIRGVSTPWDFKEEAGPGVWVSREMVKAAAVGVSTCMMH